MRCLLVWCIASLSSLAWAAAPIEHWSSPTGAQVYYSYAGNLPMVDIQMSWDAGSRRDPAGAAGTATAVAHMLEKGVLADGQQPALDAYALADAWADLAAQSRISAGQDSWSVSLRSLSQADIVQAALALLARQLTQPSLTPEVWQVERSKMQATLAEAATQPAYLARRAFDAQLYGQHPYGVSPSSASLQAIEPDLMRHFLRQHITACQAKVSIVGAISRAQAEQWLADFLAQLPQDCPTLPALPAVADAPAHQQHLVHPAAQTQILLGQIAIARQDSDFFPFLLGNHILGGGGFASLLMQRVREDHGLAYGVYSSFTPGRDRGAFEVVLQTRPDQAQRATELSLSVLEQFIQDGPTAAQLQAAKDNLIGSFPARMDSNAKLLGMVSNIAWNDLPLDYLETWTARIASVTAADIRRAFGRLPAQQWVLVQLGPDAQAAQTVSDGQEAQSTKKP